MEQEIPKQIVLKKITSKKNIQKQLILENVLLKERERETETETEGDRDRERQRDRDRDRGTKRGWALLSPVIVVTTALLHSTKLN